MRYLAVIVISFVFSSGVAAHVAGLPPDEEVQRALENHPSVAAAERRIESARSQADMLRAGANELVLSGSYANRTIDREGRYNEGDITLSRTIRLPGKASLDRKAGDLGTGVAENRSADTRHQVALLLATLWYDWLEQNELFRNDESSVQTQRRAVEALKRRVSLRDASELEVNQAMAALAAGEAQKADSFARMERARVVLANAFPEINLLSQPESMPTPALPAEAIDTLKSLVITRSHEIRAADLEAQRLSVVARRAMADRIPDPTIGTRLFKERGGLERGIGVSVSIPLGWEHRRAAASRAAADASASNFDLEDVRRSVYSSADADAVDVRTRVAVWENMKLSSESAMNAEKRTQRGYELSNVDLAELLFTQRQAIDARRAEITARAEAARAIAKLLIDSHSIWVADDHDEAKQP